MSPRNVMCHNFVLLLMVSANEVENGISLSVMSFSLIVNVVSFVLKFDISTNNN